MPSFIKSATNVSQLPEGTKPHIALLGRSNVGKSSLINHLANSKSLARISSRPGFTRTINLYDFDDGYYLVDLPGYGYTHAKPDSEHVRGSTKGLDTEERAADFSDLINHYLSEAKHLKLVLLVIDARHGMLKNDLEAFEELQANELPFAIVFNKVDAIASSKARAAVQALQKQYPDVKIVAHSSVDRIGGREIRGLMHDASRKK